MRQAKEVLQDALTAQVRSKLAPFLARYGFHPSADLGEFTKGEKTVTLHPPSFDPLEYPWIITVNAGNKNEIKPVQSTNREPYYIHTVENIRETISRITDDLEEHWLKFLEE